MEKDEWRELIKGIYTQHIVPKLIKIRRKLHPFELFEDIPYFHRSTFEASRTIRFIENNFDEDTDLTNIFRPEFLEQVLHDINNGIDFNKRHVINTGVSDVIEEFFEEIVDGMDISDIPDEDIRALREAGSIDPNSELRVSMMRIKKRKKKLIYKSNEMTIKYSINESEQIIKRRLGEIEKTKETKGEKPTRKIFKGLGGICRGVILTGVDVALISGLWPIPLSPDTTSVGAVVSMTTGLGDIMIAIGDIRGE